MKNYELKGLIVEGSKAVIAVALPKPIDNQYMIYNVHNISDNKENKIVIHFKDFKGTIAEHADNFEAFIIDFKRYIPLEELTKMDFAKDINVVLIHYNDNILKDTPEVIYNRAHSGGPIFNDTTGKGTIRP
jgi:hypothetical protein